MRMIETGHRRMMWIGLLVGIVLGLGGSCAGKGKGSRNPQECMNRCEQQQCSYDPNEVGNDEYLDCLDACQDKCSG